MKIKHLLVTLLLLSAGTIFAQQKEFQLSTHILDISEGLPAEGVAIKLEKLNQEKNTWTFIAEKKTTENGRVNDFLPSDKNNEGIYRFTFMVADYFKTKGKDSFYPFVEVAFKITGKNHYHVPITLSAFGYSTYRGN